MTAERWTTPRRCENCLAKGNTNYLTCQKWGSDEKGPQFKLDCLECGFHEDTRWDGR